MAESLTHVILEPGLLESVKICHRKNVASGITKKLERWLKDAIEVGEPWEIHWLNDNESEYQARVRIKKGGLLCTVYSASFKVGQLVPLFTFGVAAKRKHSVPLWERMVAKTGKFDEAKALTEPPAVPWCAMAFHDVLLQEKLEVIEMLLDFEHTLAFVWLELRTK